eukprot:CAMPEP_0173460758 /NCGR_PEP_ID=MMETSP1357-20121228/63715_1 /TAXON_ID=77926 /ORGANISM="Hemiselmis rufescens, Strain PCC563" /LENGTH=508 /DNA_ID=CAMNT_0014428345 /DNA_START=49 /DNA_END=1571 /DNA_ORIENTATION=-
MPSPTQNTLRGPPPLFARERQGTGCHAVRLATALLLVVGLLLPGGCACPAWRCGGLHNGTSFWDAKADLSVFAYGNVLEVDGAGISGSAVQANDGKVYVGGQDGYIRVFHKAAATSSSEDFWRSETTAWAELYKSPEFGSCPIYNTPTVLYGVSSDPSVYMVVFACGDRVIAIDGSKTVPTKLWTIDLCSYFVGSAELCDWYAGISSPVSSTTGDIIYLCVGPDNKGVCFALRSSDGSLHDSWSQNPFPSSGSSNSNLMFTSSPALLPTGRLVVGANLGSTGTLLFINALTGLQDFSQGTFTLPEGVTFTASPAAFSDGSLVICSSDGQLHKFSSTNAWLWSKASLCGTSTTLQASPAISPSGDIIVSASDPPYVRRLASDGTEVWSFCANPAYTSGACSGGAISSSPVYTPSGQVIAGGTGGTVFSLAWSSGIEAWRYAVDSASSLTSTPLVASDGSLLVGSSAGGLHVVGDRRLYDDTVPRLSMEVEVIGVSSRQLMDGRLAALKT